MDYIIIIWKDGHPVSVDTEVAEVDAYNLALTRLREMEGDSPTIHTAIDGELTKLTPKGEKAWREPFLNYQEWAQQKNQKIEDALSKAQIDSDDPIAYDDLVNRIYKEQELEETIPEAE